MKTGTHPANNPVVFVDGDHEWTGVSTMTSNETRNIDGVDHYVMCGDGDGYVKEILADLVAKGYTGGISIEPHLAAIIHSGERTDDAARLYKSYTDYGRRLMELMEGAKAAHAAG